MSKGQAFTSFFNDQEAEQDLLGFEPYVEALSEFLTDQYTEAPLSISIEGDWGSGKTSFLKQLNKKLKSKTSNYISIWFNPWRYNENEALWAAFAIEFERQLTKDWPAKIKLVWASIEKKKLLIYLIPTLLPILGLIITFGIERINGIPDLEFLRKLLSAGIVLFGLYPAVELVKQIHGKLTKSIINFDIKNYQKERPAYEGKIPFLEKFHHDLEFLAKSLVGDNRIYIFVDDLDRCHPGQAVELMQAINLMISDKLKAIFILAIDRKKVAAGVTVKNSAYIGLLGSNRDPFHYGYEFIDKFIQLPFLLPQPKAEDIDKLFDKLISPDKNTSILKSRMTEPKNETIEIMLPSPRIIQSSEQPDIRIAPRVVAPPRTIERKFEKHLGEVKDVLSEVAPLFQNNPRKIKKFLNIFRFQIYLGSQTGIFGFHNDPEAPRTSIYQLGKFLACAYIWPDFVSEWAKRSYLISDLMILGDKLAKAEPAEDVLNFLASQNKFIGEDFQRYKANLTKWMDMEGLYQFIRYDRGSSEAGGSVMAVPVQMILDVSPVYESSDFIEQPSSTMTPKTHQYDPEDLTETFLAIENYLNLNRSEGQKPYQLNGILRQIAFEMVSNGNSYAQIKDAIDSYLSRFPRSVDGPAWNPNLYPPEIQIDDSPESIEEEVSYLSNEDGENKDSMSGNIKPHNEQGVKDNSMQELSPQHSGLADLESKTGPELQTPNTSPSAKWEKKNPNYKVIAKHPSYAVEKIPGRPQFRRLIHIPTGLEVIISRNEAYEEDADLIFKKHRPDFDDK
jgi:hypothetical protein